MILLLLILILKFASFTIARVVNVTIDDTYGDELTGTVPDYESDCTQGFPDCGPGCSVDCEHPPLLPSYETYHTCLNGGFGSRILFYFERSAIYLYHHANAAKEMYAVVAIDGIVQTNYSWPALETDYAWRWYNVSLFSKTDLSAGMHNVTLESSRILFDFANYSTEIPDTPDTSSSTSISTAASVSSTSSSPAPSTSSRRNIAGPIARGIIAGFVLLIAFFATVLRVRRRQDNRQADVIRSGREMSEPVHGLSLPHEPFIPTQVGQIRTTSPSSRLEIVDALPPMQEFVTPPLPSSSRPLSFLGNLDTHPDHEALVQHVAQLQAEVTRLTAERNPAQQPHEDPPGYKES